ncbi:MAG: zf-HC2 domain-containing protein [Gammaproteobacteria bacterium]
MTRQTATSSHEDIYLLLPWYANGTLDASEQAKVEAHINGCAVCRREIEFLSGVEQAANSRNGIHALPQNGLATTLRKIEALESGGGEQPSMVDRLREYLSRLFSPGSFMNPAWATAVPALALAMLAGYLLWPADNESHEYRTLSSENKALESPLRLEVTFVAGTTVRQASDLVNGIDDRILIFAADDGSYTLEVPSENGHMTAAAVLKKLKSNAKIASVNLVLE